MRLITAIGCCLLLATFITANPDVSHLKYTRRPYKKHLQTTTSAPNTKTYTARKESTYVFKPKLISRKGLRNEKLTTEILLSTTTTTTSTTAIPPTITTTMTTPTVAESVATQTTTTITTQVPLTITSTTSKLISETTPNDDSLSVINNSDSISSSDADVKRSERDGKNLQDAWDIRHNIPGEPGVDYPIYYEAPASKFDCENRHDGYYADTEARCQVFHVCANTALEETGFIFLCPNGTVFSQENFVCDWYTNVDCPESEKYYYKNEELGRFIGSKEEMLLEVQKMFNYTLRNLLNSQGTAESNDSGGIVSGGVRNSDSKIGGSINSDIENSDSKNGVDGNSIVGENLDLKFGNFSAIPILNPKIRKPSNKTKGNSKTATDKEEVYISNLGELSTDPGADFDINVVKMQAKLKAEAANKDKAGSFSELWGQDTDQLDAILSQNRLKKSSDGKLFIEGTGSTSSPSASTVTKRDVSHLLTTTDYLPTNRYLPSLRKINLRPQTGYYYGPTKPAFPTETSTTTETSVYDSTRRTRPTTTKRVYTRPPTITKTTIVTPVTLTTTEPIVTTRRPTFKFDVTDKSESLLEYRGNFQTTEKLRGDQRPDDDTYPDVDDFESRKEKPIYLSSSNELSNESPHVVDANIETTIKSTTDADNSINTLFVLSSTLKNEPASLFDDDSKTNFPSISSTERTRSNETSTGNKEVTMMKRPIIILMPPYKINRTMDEKVQIVKVSENTQPTNTNLKENNENVMVVFPSTGKTANSGDVVLSQNKIIIEPENQKQTIERGLTPISDDTNQLNGTDESGSILFLPPFGDEQSTIGSILKQIDTTDERDGATVRISTDVIDLENQELFSPDRLNIRIRPEIQQNEPEYIESTTVRIDTSSKIELSQLEDVHTNNRDDRLALIQKMIKILEQKMKIKQGDLPDITTETPSVVTSRFSPITTTARPVTQFNLDNIIKEMETTQSQGVGANLIFAMMKILENAQNKNKATVNARPGDGSPLEPIFSSLTNAQTESPIKIRDDDILNNEDILSKTISLLQNSDDDELKTILEVNEIERIRKNGNLIFVQTTPKSITSVTNSQIDEQVENRFESVVKPQIMIKEVLRNGNSNVKQVDHTIRIIDNRVREPGVVTLNPDIKSVFDSQSINRLSESTVIRPTTDSLTSRVVEPGSQNVVKFMFGTQINNEPRLPSQMTQFTEAEPILKPVVSFGNRVDGESKDFSKSRVSEKSPVYKPLLDAQQNSRDGDSSLSISKNRFAEVMPDRGPTTFTPKPILLPVSNMQQNNGLSEPALSISKTRIAEVEPTRGPIMISPKTVLDSQQINRGNEVSQPISKTRISEVAPLNEPSSVTTKMIIKTTYDTEPNYDLSEPTLSISKTRIAAVEPAKGPNTIATALDVKTTFNTQQNDQEIIIPRPISKTQISETTPLNEPSSFVPKTTVIKTTFGSSPNNQVNEPALAITKSRLADAEPTRETFTLSPIPFIDTTYAPQQNNQVREPIATNLPSPPSSKPLVSFSFGTEINNVGGLPTQVTGISETTQQNNQLGDPSLSISKTRIAGVEPPREPSTVAPQPNIKTSFALRTNNRDGDSSLSISKNRLAAISPASEPSTSERPEEEFSFGAEINNLLNEPFRPIPKPEIKSVFDQQVTKVAEVSPLNVQSSFPLKTDTSPKFDLQLTRGSDDGQFIMPKARQEVDEVLVRELFNTNYNDNGSVSEPMTISTVTRTNNGRTGIPNIKQYVPETQHKVVQIVDQDISDQDAEVEESDTNARVEGKFTGFLNNNPDQNKIGVKSKGYVYENKLSPEVLRIYNINDIAYSSGSTFKPDESVTKINSVTPISQATTRPIIRTSTFVSNRFATPKMIVTSTTTNTTPRPTVLSTTTTRKPLPIITTTTTTKPIVLTTSVPKSTTNAVKTATVSQAPLIIRVEDSIGEKPISFGQNSDIREIVAVSRPNPLAEVSSTTTRTTAPSVPITVTTKAMPTVFIPKTETKTRTQVPVTPSAQIRPQIAIKTNTQETVSTLQPRPQTFALTSPSPTSTVHQNLLKQFPDIEITPSISESYGQIVTQEKSTLQRVSLNPSRVNTGQSRVTFSPTFGVSHSVAQYPIPSRPSTLTTQQQPSTTFRGVTNRPIQQQPSVLFPSQQLVQPQQNVFGLQDAQVRRPVQEQNKISFPNQRPQFQPNTNQFIQSQQEFNQLPGGQSINRPYETSLIVDRPVPEPVISSQFPFGSGQHVGFNNKPNGLRGKDNVIVNIVPSINWYLNDAKDRNSYFAAIQRGLLQNDNTQFNQGHLRYGVPSIFQNQNSFTQPQQQQPQQSNYFQNGNAEIIRSQSRVLGAQEHARQSEIPFPNINRIPLGAHMGRKVFHPADSSYVQNSNRRTDDSNTVDAATVEKDSVFRGLSSYNAPIASVGKLPSDSDSVSSGGR